MQPKLNEVFYSKKASSISTTENVPATKSARVLPAAPKNVSVAKRTKSAPVVEEIVDSEAEMSDPTYLSQNIWFWSNTVAGIANVCIYYIICTCLTIIYRLCLIC